MLGEYYYSYSTCSHFPATLAYTALPGFLILVKRQKEKQISHLKVKRQTVSHPGDVWSCWQGLLEECELFFRSIEHRTGRSMRKCSPSSFLGRRTFPIAHVLAAVCTQRDWKHYGSSTQTPPPFGHKSSVCVYVYVRVCVQEDCSRGNVHFPMTGKGDDSTDWT